MSGAGAYLMYHGQVWGEFRLASTPFGKVVKLQLRRDTDFVDLLEMTIVGGKLLYATAGNVPVLGGEVEHADGKEPA